MRLSGTNPRPSKTLNLKTTAATEAQKTHTSITAAMDDIDMNRKQLFWLRIPTKGSSRSRDHRSAMAEGGEAQCRAMTYNDLPDPWNQEPTEAEMNLIASNLGLPKERIGTRVVFSAPLCPVSLEYQKLLQRQGNREQVGIVIEEAREWATAYGAQGVRDFMLSMQTKGRPHHLVRMAFPTKVDQ